MRRAQAVYFALHSYTEGMHYDWDQWEVKVKMVPAFAVRSLIQRPGHSGSSSLPIEAQPLDLISNIP